MHGGGRSEDEPMAEMNMIPLIDISLTLLIIMMITTTFIKNPGFKLQLPETASRQAAQETPKDLIVAIDRNGNFWMDGKQTTDAALLQTLKVAYSRNNSVRVLVKGDQGVKYGRVSHAMDLISMANIKHINLPTDPQPTRDRAGSAGP